MRHLARKWRTEGECFYCWSNVKAYDAGYRYQNIAALFKRIPDYKDWEVYTAPVMHIIVPSDFNFWGKDNEDS